ncbi:MAG: FeoB-associated Cys-rich membrane protein [Planctomycetota bacterium]|nr:FeoB-associated Cys-rich membrane protein [Planctomycetota bacterium]
MDYIFIGVIVALAVFLLVRRLRRNLKGESSCCGQSSCCSCDSSSQETPAASDDCSCGQGGACDCSSPNKGVRDE